MKLFLVVFFSIFSTILFAGEGSEKKEFMRFKKSKLGKMIQSIETKTFKENKVIIKKSKRVNGKVTKKVKKIILKDEFGKFFKGPLSIYEISSTDRDKIIFEIDSKDNVKGVEKFIPQKVKITVKDQNNEKVLKVKDINLYDYNGKKRFELIVKELEEKDYRLNAKIVSTKSGKKKKKFVHFASVDFSLDYGEAPVPVIELSTNDGTLIAPVIMKLDGSNSIDSDGKILSYQWKLSTGQVLEGVKAEVPLSSSGNYTISLKVIDDRGNESQITENFTLNQNLEPVANFEIGTESDFIAPTNLKLKSTSSDDGEIISYVWRTSTGEVLAGDNVSFFTATPGEYSIKLEVTDNKGAIGSIEKKIQILENQLPYGDILTSVEDIQVGNEVILSSSISDSDGIITDLEWTLPNGAKVKGEKVNYLFSSFGEFEFTLKAVDNKGGEVEISKKINVIQGEHSNENLASSSVLFVYPNLLSESINPFFDSLTIRASEQISNKLSIKINGVQIKGEDVTQVSNDFILRNLNLKSGKNFIEITGKDNFGFPVVENREFFFGDKSLVIHSEDVEGKLTVESKEFPGIKKVYEGINLKDFKVENLFQGEFTISFEGPSHYYSGRVNGEQSDVTLNLKSNLPVSSVENNDFSKGVEGWNYSSDSIQVIQDEDGFGVEVISSNSESVLNRAFRAQKNGLVRVNFELFTSSLDTEYQIMLRNQTTGKSIFFNKTARELNLTLNKKTPFTKELTEVSENDEIMVEVLIKPKIEQTVLNKLLNLFIKSAHAVNVNIGGGIILRPINEIDSANDPHISRFKLFDLSFLNYNLSPLSKLFVRHYEWLNTQTNVIHHSYRHYPLRGLSVGDIVRSGEQRGGLEGIPGNGFYGNLEVSNLGNGNLSNVSLNFEVNTGEVISLPLRADVLNDLNENSGNLTIGQNTEVSRTSDTNIQTYYVSRLFDFSYDDMLTFSQLNIEKVDSIYLTYSIDDQPNTLVVNDLLPSGERGNPFPVLYSLMIRDSGNSDEVRNLGKSPTRATTTFEIVNWGGDQWGRKHVVDSLNTFIETEILNTNRTSLVQSFRINDLSNMNGGHFSGHSSHKYGISLDFFTQNIQAGDINPSNNPAGTQFIQNLTSSTVRDFSYSVVHPGNHRAAEDLLKMLDSPAFRHKIHEVYASTIKPDEVSVNQYSENRSEFYNLVRGRCTAGNRLFQDLFREVKGHADHFHFEYFKNPNRQPFNGRSARLPSFDVEIKLSRAQDNEDFVDYSIRTVNGINLKNKIITVSKDVLVSGSNGEELKKVISVYNPISKHENFATTENRITVNMDSELFELIPPQNYGVNDFVTLRVHKVDGKIDTDFDIFVVGVSELDNSNLTSPNLVYGNRDALERHSCVEKKIKFKPINPHLCYDNFLRFVARSKYTNTDSVKEFSQLNPSYDRYGVHEVEFSSLVDNRILDRISESTVFEKGTVICGDVSFTGNNIISEGYVSASPHLFGASSINLNSSVDVDTKGFNDLNLIKNSFITTGEKYGRISITNSDVLNSDIWGGDAQARPQFSTIDLRILNSKVYGVEIHENAQIEKAVVGNESSPDFRNLFVRGNSSVKGTVLAKSGFQSQIEDALIGKDASIYGSFEIKGQHFFNGSINNFGSEVINGEHPVVRIGTGIETEERISVAKNVFITDSVKLEDGVDIGNVGEEGKDPVYISGLSQIKAGAFVHSGSIINDTTEISGQTLEVVGGIFHTRAKVNSTYHDKPLYLVHTNVYNDGKVEGTGQVNHSHIGDGSKLSGNVFPSPDNNGLYVINSEVLFDSYIGENAVVTFALLEASQVFNSGAVSGSILRSSSVGDNALVTGSSNLESSHIRGSAVIENCYLNVVNTYRSQNPSDPGSLCYNK